MLFSLPTFLHFKRESREDLSGVIVEGHGLLQAQLDNCESPLRFYGSIQFSGFSGTEIDFLVPGQQLKSASLTTKTKLIILYNE